MIFAKTMLSFKPFKFIKRFLPQSFFGRSLMIVITPVVLIQIFSGYVFFDRHWDYVTRVLAKDIAGDVSVVVKLLEEAPHSEETTAIQRMAQEKMALIVTWVSGGWDHLPRSQEIFQSFLEEALSEKLDRRPYALNFDPDWIHIWVKTDQGILYIKTIKKRLFSRTTSLFLTWSLGSSLVFVILAALFMRGQIRPLRQLSYLAEQLGRGRPSEKYKPTGASEIRKVGTAFRVMNLRLQRQLQERTEMLAGISHDLRTPLTRMKLQLALMPDSTDVADLQEDVNQMTHMVEGYLAFSRGEEAEVSEKILLLSCLQQILKTLETQEISITLSVSPTLSIMAQPRAIHRCLSNLIENALRYAHYKITISAHEESEKTLIIIDDDGPGILPEHRDNVFKPFFRVDASRNSQTGGVGLGLSIVKNLMKAQGGTVHLGDSPAKGLRVILTLPTLHKKS